MTPTLILSGLRVRDRPLFRWGLRRGRQFGIRVKSPKTKRGLRRVDLDDGTIAMLLAERENFNAAGAAADPAIVRLPASALMAWDQLGSTFALRSARPCAKRLKLLVWKGGRVV